MGRWASGWVVMVRCLHFLTQTEVLMHVPEQEYARIESEIESSESPVGIDAKKTHVIILHKLMQIERRLTELEKRLGG